MQPPLAADKAADQWPFFSVLFFCCFYKILLCSDLVSVMNEKRTDDDVTT